MGRHHVATGIVLLAATLIYAGVKFLRAPRRGTFAAWGWAGLAIILLSEFLLFHRLPWVTTFFTPLVWTGYVLLVDALVGQLEGESRLTRSPAELLALAFWSVPLWLIFEAYNLRLENWTYVGLPAPLAVRGVGYFWSFATIWPAIFETADLVRALGAGQGKGESHSSLNRTGRAAVFALGLLALTLPVLLPAWIGQYLFGLVWFGFVLLLDPINYRWDGRSLLRGWERGESSTFWSFFIAGWVCGILWEFWNFWAGAKWLYVFPIGQGLRVFEMPLPGYFGFPFFALECFVMYEFLRGLRRRLAGGRRGSSWSQALVSVEGDVRPAARP